MVCGSFFRRRESTDVEDLFIAHIAGMDTLARGLRNAVKLIEDGSLDELVRKRYSSFDTELGAQIEVIYSLLSNHIPLICNVFFTIFHFLFCNENKNRLGRLILKCWKRKSRNGENPKFLQPNR